MINVSQQYLDAAILSFRQTVADLASSCANLAGILADRDATITQLQAKITELEKPKAPESTVAPPES